jgi:hypothetical protein
MQLQVDAKGVRMNRAQIGKGELEDETRGGPDGGS